MPTVQIRDVPEDVHLAYRRRAAEAGMSLQEFLLAELVAGAQTLTPAEVASEVARRIADSGGRGFATGSAADDIRDNRDAG